MNRLARTHRRRGPLVLGVGPAEHHQALDPAAQRGEPRPGLHHRVLGVLVGGGGRAGRAPRRSPRRPGARRRSRSPRCHSPAADQARVPGVASTGATVERPGQARAAGARPVSYSPGNIPGYVNHTRGNRRLGDHGLGHRRDGGRQRLRGGPALPEPVHGRRHPGRRWRSRSTGRSRRASGPRPSATRPWPGSPARPTSAPSGLRPGHRVGRRGPGREEAPLQRARPDLRRPHHPGHQHLDPPGRRAGHGDRPARQGLRHPLLQPGAGDGAGRGGPADHRLRRDDRRGPRRSPRPAARRRSRSRTRPASSSTPCSSPTSTTPCGSRAGGGLATTSTPP